MKIGILTFHSAHNYGAVLQTYGTQEYLKSLGHDVEIIDYRPEYISKPFKLIDLGRIIHKNPLKTLKNGFREIAIFRRLLLRYTRFNKFINNRLQLSDSVSNTIPNNYDAYIFGSDQIWNPKLTKGFDKIFFGNFAVKEGAKKIAYAASMEAIELTSQQKEFFIKELENLDSIGVREFQLQRLLQPLTSKPITTVLDPTLLLESSIWKKIAVKPEINQKYVLVYQVRASQETLKIANDIAKQIGGVVVQLTAKVYWKNIKRRYQSASVEEFLGWINYADCVVTTSFHGTVFASIFNRPFYTVSLHDGGDSRSGSLLQNIGLSERLIPTGTFPVFKEIDYSEVNVKLNEVRKGSYSFLDTALK